MSDETIFISERAPRVIGNLFDLIKHLPDGDVAVVRAPSNQWDIAIFESGATKRLATVAHDMDKGTATFLVAALTTARTLAKA